MHNALMCLPDGMPLVWMARLWGLKDVGRSAGPDLFTTMLQDEKSHIKHFLLGDTDETPKAISEKYKNITEATHHHSCPSTSTITKRLPTP
ncbi:MAG: WecB/TagA/CpsF family glycosyltransferase [Bacteroidaceae bacterium]|nr:WecB/TagA/CpsF family glycosyltransferase [Bacteroidaceae bacterium]